MSGKWGLLLHTSVITLTRFFQKTRLAIDCERPCSGRNTAIAGSNKSVVWSGQHRSGWV